MKKSSPLLGAAFLMATSAIGPGFLTQTTVFTQQLLYSFGFVILVSILLDIGAQLNIWRILTVAELRAQDIANKLAPGLGYFLAALIVLGGLAFNIGNIGGASLGLNVVTALDPVYGAAISGCVAVAIFWMKEAGKAMDVLTKVLGILMILLTLFVAISSGAPLGLALQNTVAPETIDTTAIITIVGGTVGGYITFAGAHRLIDAGITGKDNLPTVSRSAVTGIIITSIMRYTLFIAALGVVAGGALIDSSNPPASVFRNAAGSVGYTFFGIVMWCAAITSVVGAAYTSISFLRTLNTSIDKNYRSYTTAFIVFSTLVFMLVGRPVKILVAAGAVNGLILPIGLTMVLLAARKNSLMKDYKHPLWLQLAGWIVVMIMLWLSVVTIVSYLN